MLVDLLEWNWFWLIIHSTYLLCTHVRVVEIHKGAKSSPTLRPYTYAIYYFCSIDDVGTYSSVLYTC